MFMARGIPSVEVHLGSSLPAAAACANVDGGMDAEYDNAPGNSDGHDHATPEAGVELDWFTAPEIYVHVCACDAARDTGPGG